MLVHRQLGAAANTPWYCYLPGASVLSATCYADMSSPNIITGAPNTAPVPTGPLDLIGQIISDSVAAAGNLLYAAGTGVPSPSEIAAQKAQLHADLLQASGGDPNSAAYLNAVAQGDAEVNAVYAQAGAQASGPLGLSWFVWMGIAAVGVVGYVGYQKMR